MARSHWPTQRLRRGAIGVVVLLCLVDGLLVVHALFPAFIVGSRDIRVSPFPPHPNGSVAFLAPGSTDADGDVWTVSTADGKARFALPLTELQDSAPSWSPDGQRIAFTMGDVDHHAIYMMQHDGSGLHRVTNTPASESFPVWTPDGQHLRFFVQHDSTLDIEEIRLDGTQRKRLTKHPIEPAYVVWSPDRSYLALWKPAAQGDAISIMTVSGDIIIPSLTGSKPSWSPDSSHITFAQDRALVTLRVRDGQLTQLATNTNFVSLPVWSPDGNYIAFVSGVFDVGSPPSDTITIIELDNNHTSQLQATKATDIGNIQWSPDGHWLLYEYSGGPGSHSKWNGISVIALDGSHIFPIGGGLFSSWIP